MTLDQLQTLLKWLILGISLAVFSCICISVLVQGGSRRSFGEMWDAQKNALKSADSIALLLILELTVFAVTFFVILFNKEGKEAADFFAFAAPCIAGIIVGLGLIAKAADTKPTSDPFALFDYRVYVYSLILFFASLVAYLIAHFDVWVFSWVTAYFCGICTLGYGAALTVTKFNERHREASQPSLITGTEWLIGLALVAITVSIFYFIPRNKDWLLPETEQAKKCCCNSADDKSHNEKISYPFEGSDIGSCILIYGLHGNSCGYYYPYLSQELIMSTPSQKRDLKKP
jgi:preprotein translocase subunit SecG